MTYANNNVLEFYKTLPFNYRDSVEDHAESILQKQIGDYYPFLDPYLKSRSRVLDVGCGSGWFGNTVALHNKCLVEAIDYNPVAIARAQSVSEYLRNWYTIFLVADLFKYKPLSPADLVVSLGVLHHTNNCIEGVKKLCNEFVALEGYVFIGLYHKYGRRPFLDEFKKMKDKGASEEEMYDRYCELDSRFTDETHSRSWFRDQVLHPHETTHTMEEMTEVLNECGMTVVETSIKEKEETYYDQALERLKENKYCPGFFVFLAQRTSL